MFSDTYINIGKMFTLPELMISNTYIDSIKEINKGKQLIMLLIYQEHFKFWTQTQTNISNVMEALSTEIVLCILFIAFKTRYNKRNLFACMATCQGRQCTLGYMRTRYKSIMIIKRNRRSNEKFKFKFKKKRI